MTSITNLPPELLLEIFGYLSPDDLLDSVQNVCCTWRELAQHHSLWEDFVYSPSADITFEDVVLFFEKCPMLKHIHDYIGVFRKIVGPEELISVVIKNCADIRTFCVSFGLDCLTMPQVDMLLQAFPNLEFFEVMIDSHNAAQAVDRISKCRRLKKLILKSRKYCDCLFEPIVRGCISLDYLSISCPGITESDYVFILQNMKDRLSYVSFNFHHPTTQQVIDVLGSYTKLHSLNLHHYAALGFIDFLPLVSVKTLKCFAFTSNTYTFLHVASIFDVLFRKPFPLLVKLSVRIHNCKCSRVILQAICQCYPKLKYLNLWYRPPDGCRDNFEYISLLENLENLVYYDSKTITDDDTKHIGRCCKLKHLELDHSFGLTDKTVVHIANCKSLESLNLSYCPISGQSLHVISENLENLKFLEIHGIKANQEDVNVLAKNMPSLHIRF